MSGEALTDRQRYRLTAWLEQNAGLLEGMMYEEMAERAVKALGFAASEADVHHAVKVADLKIATTSMGAIARAHDRLSRLNARMDTLEARIDRIERQGNQLDALMTPSEAAAFLGVSGHDLARLRRRRDRPVPYVTLANRVRYRPAELRQWQATESGGDR